MTTSIHPLAQEQVACLSFHHSDSSSTTPPVMISDTLSLAPINDQVVPSLCSSEMRSTHHTDPAPQPRHDPNLHVPQSLDLPLPQQHQQHQHQHQPQQQQQQHQRAYSVTAMPNEFKQSVMRHQQEVAEQQRRMLQDQPWWQRYYQLYHYNPPPGRKPTVFGPYLLLQTLGEGEFGKVKLAIHIKTGREAAIKLIKKDNIDSSSRMTKVEREISVLRIVRHPYIVKLFDVLETERYIGIILQCASGGELFEYILAHRYLKEKEAKRLFAQLISGVHYMHQKHIVHRDLKLENLLLDKDRNIVITDFGFANQFASAHDDLMSTSCGSPCYAAPELVVSEGLYVGSAVDIWSCGVILYAMLCGYLPFDDDPANPDSDNINLLYKYILNTQLAFPNYVSHEARDLLCKMLVPDPAKRCSMKTIMEHPWLMDHWALFQKSIDDLEMEATEEASPLPPVVEQSQLQRPKLAEERRYTYAAPPRVPSVGEEQETEHAHDADQDPTDIQSNSLASANGSAQHSKTRKRSNTVGIDKQTQPSTLPASLNHVFAGDQAAAQRDTSETLRPTRVKPNTSNASPRPNSGSSSLKARDQQPAHINPVIPEHELLHLSPSPSKKRGKEKILNFLSGSSNTPSSRTSKKPTRPFSMTTDNWATPGNSILHAKFLSSMNRVSHDVHEAGKPEPIGASFSTPLGVHAPVSSLTAAATRLSQEPSRYPRPTVGLSQPIRSGRPKALSLLVADKDAIKLPFRRPQYTPAKPPVIVTETTTSITMLSSKSEYLSHGLPSSPTSPSSRYKQRSSGKKLMDWFKNKPLSTKERMSLTGHHAQLFPSVSTSKPLGSYALDFNDTKLRTHQGAVDQNALTSRPPQEAFGEICQALISMGIDVKSDGEYKLKCTRRKRPNIQRSTKISHLPSESDHVAKPNTTDSAKKRLTAGTPKFRMLLRRTSPTSPTANDLEHLPHAILYGDPKVDPGEEVRFSVELCKIKNLPGLYIVDVRRLRGNVRSYKHLYHTVLDFLDLGGKGGYMSTRIPNQSHSHLSPQHRQDWLSTASSQSSNALEDHRDES